MPPLHPYCCILCNKRTKARERRYVNDDMKKFLRKEFFVDASCQDILCNKCRHLYKKAKTGITRPQQPTRQDPEDPNYEPPQQNQHSSRTISSPPSVTLNIPSTSRSHNYCFICKRPGPKLVVVSATTRFQTFLNHNIFVPAGVRCCPRHLNNGEFIPSDIDDLTTTDSVQLNRSTILDLFSKLRSTVHRHQSPIYFDDDSLSDSDYMNLTGLSKANFDDLCTYIIPFVRNTPTRTSRTTLGIFLLKLKSGMSNKLLSTIFSISKSSVRRAVATARQALMISFVPPNLGIQHISRDDVIHNHTRPLAQSLFGTGNSVILVLDGTYIYIQKSSNFQFQRRSYSVHKGRPLLKPMIITTTTGHFVSVMGPYLADGRNNDASILKHILHTNVENFKSWLQDDDVFIVDRGFRDALGLLEEFGIKAEMPCFMKKGDKQMSTEDANASRLVTKVRWVVEAANSRIKQWKYLDHVLPTNQVPYVGDYVSIVCAISNKYSPPLSSGNDDDIALASKMSRLSSQINHLKTEVEEKHLERRSAQWMEADELTDFPHLDEHQLRDITCGSYQLKLSTSYMQEHIDGECVIQVHREDANLVRVKLRSRHVSAKAYLLWVRYNSQDIESWYCKCRAGARVVGVCSHVASILWYLGYARHTEMAAYGVRNWGAFVVDAANIPESVDSSDSGSSDDNVEE